MSPFNGLTFHGKIYRKPMMFPWNMGFSLKPINWSIWNEQIRFMWICGEWFLMTPEEPIATKTSNVVNLDCPGWKYCATHRKHWYCILSYRILMVFLYVFPFSYGFPRVFLWFSYTLTLSSTSPEWHFSPLVSHSDLERSTMRFSWENPRHFDWSIFNSKLLVITRG